MKVAFIYIAEPYQCYHSASVSSFLAKVPGYEVTEFYDFPETIQHLRRIRDAIKEPDLYLRPLSKSLKVNLLKSCKRFDQARLQMLKENVDELEKYDVVVATEYTAGALKKMGLSKPKLVLLMHGAGDRFVQDECLVSQFDFVLLPGSKTMMEFTRKNLIKSGHFAVVGYPKFDVIEAIGKECKIRFDNGRPFALYNPHYKRNLTSSPAWMNTIINQFKNNCSYNLVVAPHIKQFQKGIGIKKNLLKRKENKKIIIDTGSPFLLDMTYTAQASLYIGDVSSQVYEYLFIPKPCVFLNPRKIKWQNDPHFLHWTLGDVVEDASDILPAIERAADRHSIYRPVQERLFCETFGYPLLGASQRAVEAIVESMKNGKN